MSLYVPNPAAIGPGDLTCVPVGGPTGRAIRWAEKWAQDTDLDPAALACQHVVIHLGFIERVVTDDRGNERDLAHRGWDGKGWYVAQAEPDGASLRRLGASEQSAVAAMGPDAVWTTGYYPLEPAQRTAIVRRAVRGLGAPYSFADYAWLGAHRKLHANWGALEDFIEDSGHMICSQYGDWSWQTVVPLFSDGRWNGDVMPSDIAQLVVKKAAGS